MTQELIKKTRQSFQKEDSQHKRQVKGITRMMVKDDSRKAAAHRAASAE